LGSHIGSFFSRYQKSFQNSLESNTHTQESSSFLTIFSTHTQYNGPDIDTTLIFFESVKLLFISSILLRDKTKSCPPLFSMLFCHSAKKYKLVSGATPVCFQANILLTADA
jgi:hypothetical protein